MGANARTGGRQQLHVRKYAGGGAPNWAEAMINGFDPVSSIDARTCDTEDKASTWVF